ncbi:hypothetical protein PIB30_094331 [Stylosanthes scabra]|uniref:Uncharacterized protein n=1 Tax=Stylosanthes scabra TaxID=79078 RepID=A0ABU6UU95_9FABA|nr:hypothetical protein [Stylosanthes scabra]
MHIVTWFTNPRRRHSPLCPRVNLRSPAVVFSVTGSRGEGSIENHEDPHLGNGPVDPTLAIRVFWCRRGYVAAATTTVEPPSEDRTSKARTTPVLPRSPVLGVLPRSPVFWPCHSFSPSVQLQPPLTSHRVQRHSTFRPCFVAPPPSQVSANPPNGLKIEATMNRLQLSSGKLKKVVEGSSNVRFEAVQEKLTVLLDGDGGISKRKFFFTSPLACDLSGLPVIHREDDEIEQAKEQVK